MDYAALAENALNEANGSGGNGDSPEPEAPQVESQASVGDESAASPEAAPVADVPAPSPAPAAASPWQPPSRDQWESMQREAEMARRFDPTKIAEAFRAGLHPQSPQAQQAPEDRDYDTYFGSNQGWIKFWNDLRTDPKVLERGVNALVARGRKQDFETIRTLKDEFGAYKKQMDQELAEMRGFRRLSEHRFAESPRWKAHGKTVEGYFQKGIFNVSHPDAIEQAFDFAEKLARKQGASPAQAAAAGAQAAQAVATGKQPAAAPVAGKKPEPRDEPSLRGDKRPAKGSGEDADAARSKRLTDPRYFNKLASEAVRKAAAGATS